MKVLKEVLKSITTIFLVIALPIIIFTLLTSKTDLVLGVKSYNVLTGSMEPIIQTGSMIFIQPESSYKIGEIVTYKSGDITITHRIVDEPIKDGAVYYQTKGDANKSADPKLVAKGQILGAALFHFPVLGKLTSLIKTPIGFVITIVLPTLIFIGFEVWEIKEEYRKEVEKKLLEKLNMA